MPRLTHDKTTWLTYAQMGLWGFFLYGFGPVVPLLRDEQGTSAAVAGLHSTAVAVGALLGGALFAPLARRVGRGGAIWTGLAGVALGVTAFGLLRPLPATLAAVAVIATAGMMVISGVAVVLTARHGEAAPAALTEANAACAGMGILAPLVIGASVDAGWGWRPVMAVEVGLIALVALAATAFRVRLPHGAPPAAAAPVGAAPSPAAAPVGAVSASAGAEPNPILDTFRSPGTGTVQDSGPGTVSGRLPRAYWIAWVLMAVTGSIEVCLSLWTADVLRSHAGMSAGAASAAVAAIVCGMFLGRLAGGRVALRWAPAQLLLAALTVSLLGFTLFWIAPVGWLAVTGLVVLGLGNALHYPLAISIALAVAGPAADKAAGWSSYSMGVGFGIAPVALGWVADGVGPHLAFLLLPGFIAAAVLLTVRLGRALRTPATPDREPVPA
ncbi:MFS transporter [Micromonospora siamensis]|uniref:Fucose permease n=1 Tax=Micromonospora siamensis TaxID=299152 RepID=A0A1C5HCH4_9ACTN|nr:MFS transporter [Micromonospora siamensis]SCG43732.1 Fucose permease [Micromonospora siamensis]